MGLLYIFTANKGAIKYPYILYFSGFEICQFLFNKLS